jgi:hypothetical protein
MPRKQTSLAAHARDVTTSPLTAATRFLRAKVIDTDPKSGRVAVALNRSGVLRNVQVSTGMAGTRTGSWGLPQVWNSPAAIPPKNGGRIYDEAALTKAHDTYAIVGFFNGSGNAPIVLGMTPPNAHQMSFDEHNLQIERTVHDHHTVQWSDDQKDLRPPPFGDGGDKDDPYTALNGNWQMIFPDRYQDKPVSARDLKFGDHYQTFLSVGYHDQPRQFGDGESSANFDNDYTPWQLSPKQKGDDPEKGQQYARGIWLNQRWRTRLALDAQGNVELRAEGLDYDSTHFTNKTDSFGTMTLWSRLGYQGWHRDKFEWVRMRPRHDGKKPESLEQAKATGSASLRVQRDWDVSVRRSVKHTYVEDFTLQIGDYDTTWNSGPGGQDPGLRWDEADDTPVLNPDFKSTLGDDKIWRGTKKDDYLRAANVAFTFARPLDSLKDGPQTFVWTIDNRQIPIDGENTSDCNWSLEQSTVKGHVNWSSTLTPKQGHANATWTLTGDEDDATYAINVNAQDPHNATVTLVAVAKYTTSITLDAEAGTVAIVAPNGLTVNGTTVSVP